MESARPRGNGLEVRMLGPLSVRRDGTSVVLPGSRKTRAVFAYLALAPHAVSRSRLCDLLWETANDPRGELRWCLSKIRSFLDEPHLSRITSDGEMVAIDLSGCSVDALDVVAAIARGPETVGPAHQQALIDLFGGDFLEGLALESCPQFHVWVLAQRRRLEALHITLREQRISSLPPASDAAMPHLEKWVELAPFDTRAHLALLGALARRGQFAACGEHLRATALQFAAEELDVNPLLTSWQDLRREQTGARHAESSAVDLSQPQDLLHAASAPQSQPHRASLAIMPFVLQTESMALHGGMADGLTHDIITRLAKLRDLFVIARGSVFALAEQSLDPLEAGRKLDVDYVASGSVRRQPGLIAVTIELLETRSARIVWADTVENEADDAFLMIEAIGNRIVSSITSEIETIERDRAILKPPNSLDAWEAYHRGLWHMYRFTRTENELAQHFFEMSIRLDPGFARAHAAMSFTHWQSAFQRWADRETETKLAFATAARSLSVDDLNPAAHLAMGRAMWLQGEAKEAIVSLDRALGLSPNFALGHYALSFVQAQSGDPEVAISASDRSRLLSPFDPLLFGMLGARALAHARLGQFDEAAAWAERASARPNAHANIMAIAAHCLALAGRQREASAYTLTIHTTLPHYRTADFLDAFRFTKETEAMFRSVSSQIGMD